MDEPKPTWDEVKRLVDAYNNFDAEFASFEAEMQSQAYLDEVISLDGFIENPDKGTSKLQKNEYESTRSLETTTINWDMPFDVERVRFYAKGTEMWLKRDKDVRWYSDFAINCLI
jgi:hypothetical protein